MELAVMSLLINVRFKDYEMKWLNIANRML
jgi:hypothetical protein